jgi:hypothetical protein
MSALYPFISSLAVLTLHQAVFTLLDSASLSLILIVELLMLNI